VTKESNQKMFRNSCFLVLAVIALSGCATFFDPGAASLRLRQGMTESEAIAAVGRPPTSAEVRVCGGSSSPWNCRILTFKAFDQIHELTVFEAKSDGEWRVDSWSVL
jgi:hypothetical protein